MVNRTMKRHSSSKKTSGKKSLRGGYTYGASRKKVKGRRRRTNKSRRKGSHKKKARFYRK